MARRFYSRAGLVCLLAATADAQARGKAINGGAGQLTSGCSRTSNNGMQRPALRAAAEGER